MKVHADAGIERPEDLKGKRLGVPDYTLTAAVWMRGQLQHEFGVKPTDVIWFEERRTRLSIREALGGFKPPPGLDFRHATTDLATIFLIRGIDVITNLDLLTEDLTGHPKLISQKALLWKKTPQQA